VKDSGFLFETGINLVFTGNLCISNRLAGTCCLRQRDMEYRRGRRACQDINKMTSLKHWFLREYVNSIRSSCLLTKLIFLFSSILKSLIPFLVKEGIHSRTYRQHWHAGRQARRRRERTRQSYRHRTIATLFGPSSCHHYSRRVLLDLL
jgi:hypothetical protein